MIPYRFSKGATKIEPTCEAAKLFHKLRLGQWKFSREEKDRIVDILYGMGGQHQGTYSVLGWRFPFYCYLKRFIVRHYDNWSVYYGPDKTSIRHCNYIKTGLKEIHEIPKI